MVMVCCIYLDCRITLLYILVSSESSFCCKLQHMFSCFYRIRLQWHFWVSMLHRYLLWTHTHTHAHTCFIGYLLCTHTHTQTLPFSSKKIPEILFLFFFLLLLVLLIFKKTFLLCFSFSYISTSKVQ